MESVHSILAYPELLKTTEGSHLQPPVMVLECPQHGLYDQLSVYDVLADAIIFSPKTHKHTKGHLFMSLLVGLAVWLIA